MFIVKGHEKTLILKGHRLPSAARESAPGALAPTPSFSSNSSSSFCYSYSSSSPSFYPSSSSSFSSSTSSLSPPPPPQGRSGLEGVCFSSLAPVCLPLTVLFKMSREFSFSKVAYQKQFGSVQSGEEALVK